MSGSLAGRTGIIEPGTFSQREAAGPGAQSVPIFAHDTLPELLKSAPRCGRNE